MTSLKHKKHKEMKPFAVKHSGERYIIGSIIGQGGYAIVVEGHDRDLKRPVALKVLRKAFNHREDIVLRFLNEGQIMAQLNCTGVVPIYEIGQLKDNSYYFAMPLIQGQNLREYLKNLTSNFTIREAVNIFLNIVKTIAVAHSQGIIHRDLKPENIMIDKLNSVFIVDWGLSKYQREVVTETNISDIQLDFDAQNLTMEGELNGTPLYMSPEQVLGLNNRTTTQSDIFCLGILLYELLMNCNPFMSDKNSFKQIIKKSSRLTIPTKNFNGEKIASELRAILEKVLDFLPEKRYQNGGELFDDLTNYINKRPVRAYRTDFIENCRNFLKRNAKALMLGFIFLGIVVNIFLIQYFDSRSYFQSHNDLHKLVQMYKLKINKAYTALEKLQSSEQNLQYILDNKERQLTLGDINRMRIHLEGFWWAIKGDFEYLYSNDRASFDNKVAKQYMMLWVYQLEKAMDNSDLKKGKQVFGHIASFIKKNKLVVDKEISIRLQYYQKKIKDLR